MDLEKSRLRCSIEIDRQQFVKNLSVQEKDSITQKIQNNLLPLITNIKKSIIAGYWPLETEVDTRPILLSLYKQGYKICLPKIIQDNMLFKAWQPEDALERGSFGFKEPKENALTLTPEIILMPLLAFDPEGNRLGFGKGHYDKTLEHLLKNTLPTLIGLAFEMQKVAKVPRLPHDVPLQFVVTEEKVYNFS